MGNPSLLQHTWSLAVEEQFYIVWPLLLVPCLVLVGRKRLPMLVIAGIAASAALMWILYNAGQRSLARLLRHRYARLPAPDGDPARARLAVDHADPAGGAAARAARHRGARRRRSSSSGTMQDFNPTLYRGGDLAAAFCFAVLVAAVAHPETGIGEAFGVAPLRWVGERSYGIYLWHWPIIVLARRCERPAERGRRRRRGSSRPRDRRALVQATSSSRSGRGSLQRRLARHPRALPARGHRRGSAGTRRGVRDPLRDAVLAEPGLELRQPAEGETAPTHPPAARSHAASRSTRPAQAQQKQQARYRRAGSSRSATR